MFTASSTRGLVDKATADEDAPTPGYLYNDIAKATFKSLKDCQVVEDQLLMRLNKNVSSVVKLKCLRVAKHCVLKGDISFKRDLQRRLGPIRACLEYRGPSDPIHGDSIYRQIRDEAQELMNAIFDTEDQGRPRGETSSPEGGPAATAAPALRPDQQLGGGEPTGGPRFMTGFGGGEDQHASSSSSPLSSASSRLGEFFTSIAGLASPAASVGSGSGQHGVADASFTRYLGPSKAEEGCTGPPLDDGRSKKMEGMGNTPYDPPRHPAPGREGLMAKLKRAGDLVVGGSGEAAYTSNLSSGSFKKGSYHSPAPLRPHHSPGSGYVPGVSPTAGGVGEGGHDQDEVPPAENIWERGDREWRASASSSADASTEDHHSLAVASHHHHQQQQQQQHSGEARPFLEERGREEEEEGEEEEKRDDEDEEEEQVEEDYVRQLVTEITSPGGVRVGPAAAVLAQFCLRCESLPESQRLAVFRALNRKLSSSSSDSPLLQQRTLHVVAGLLTRRVDGAEKYFAEHDESLRSLAASSVPASRAKASAIVQALIQGRGDAISLPSATMGAGFGLSWLDVDEGQRRGDARNTSPPPPHSPSPSQQHTSFSLYEGLSVRDGQQKPGSPHKPLLGDDPFEFLLAGPSTPPLPAASQQRQQEAAVGAAHIEQQLHGLSMGGSSSLLPLSPSSSSSYSASLGLGRTPAVTAFPSSSVPSSASSSGSAFSFLDGECQPTGPSHASLAMNGDVSRTTTTTSIIGSTTYGTTIMPHSPALTYVALLPGMPLYGATTSVYVHPTAVPSAGASTPNNTALGSGGRGEGFSFINSQPEDSFSFVKEEMEANKVGRK